MFFYLHTGMNDTGVAVTDSLSLTMRVDRVDSIPVIWFPSEVAEHDSFLIHQLLGSHTALALAGDAYNFISTTIEPAHAGFSVSGVK